MGELEKQMMKDHARRVRALADGKAKDATITRLSSELAASRDREMALERERDEARKYAVQLRLENRDETDKLRRKWDADALRAEAAEAEVKRLRAETIEECAKEAERHFNDSRRQSKVIAAAIRALATTGLQGGDN